ncbi:MAG: undecaprenyl-phosphate glucose phosphotransferase [Myxococcota bacterium]|jgi:putative colanic acid biosysnthesis UDP-glucose lipid carrier transferase|nr:undecaprenyl-phosphate glucose phosphotransferase [Myxococcota bacterium]
MAPLDDSKPGWARSHQSSFSILQRLGDALLIIGTQYLSVVLHGEEWDTKNALAATVAVVAFYLAAEMNGLYRSWRGQPFRNESITVLSTWFVTVPVLLFVAFVAKLSAEFSRVTAGIWFLSAPALMMLWRLVFRTILAELRIRGRNLRAVGIAGATQMAESLARRIQHDPALGMKVVGIYDDRIPARRHGIPEEYGAFAGDIDKLVADARAGRLDIIYITLPLKAEPRINLIIRRLADTTATVNIVADFMAFDPLHSRWGAVGDIPVVSIFDTPFFGVGGWLKRVEDVVLASLILLMIAVPMLVIGVLVKLSSKGPMLFAQRRYGLNGKSIRVLKFRTMTVCEDGDDVKQATREDDRFIKLGKFPLGAFLRRTSLDELPQFVNVLGGEMSIVGPRPHAIKHNELYRAKIHGYMLRHKVKPGITGWAQVNGWRGETDTDEKMVRRIEHDLAYIRNWRLLWDLEIIFLTVFGRKSSKNAY